MPQNLPPLILLSAGGTGGHVFPARALAEVLLARGYRVALATDRRGEKYFAGLDRVPLYILASGGYQAGVMGKIKGAVGLLQGYVAAHFLLSKIKPSIVVGFGGYPSAPAVFAAQHRCIQTVLHEQNAILGLANSLLAPCANGLALSFSNTAKVKEKWNVKSRVIGNPVRADIAALGPINYPKIENTLNVLIVGGSQGARVFGTIIPEAITTLPLELRQKLIIAHQARPEDLEHVKSMYLGVGMSADVRSFFDDMPARLEKAQLLITRSGASTVAELTASGRPAIYVPFPWNRDLQQVFNAENLVKAGGGWMILEQDLTVNALQTQLKTLLENPEILENAAKAAYLQAQPEAAPKLADMIAEFY